MIDVIARIAELQRHYSADNTPEMRERGRLIRHELPAALKKHLPLLQRSLGPLSDDLEIEGRDGIGRKTQAPWVRIFSKALSPSATTGWYVVIHFSADGTSCFVTLGCSATKWDSDRGDLIKESDSVLLERVSWARSTLRRKGFDTSDFPDAIAIGSSHALPQAFEKATALCKRFSVETLSESEFTQSLARALELLAAIYEDYGKLYGSA